VSSPTFTHAPIIEQAAQAGVSVFTEKPVGESAQQIQQLFDTFADAASAAKIHLCCGFQRRFDPSYKAAATAISQGDVGTPIVAHVFFADHPAPPKQFMLQGGDIFLDLSAHDVDFVTHALQDHVVSVYATGTSMDPELKQAGIHDNAIMVMNLSKGAVVTLFMSRSATYGYDQRVEVFGTKGMITVQNQPETTTVLATDRGIRHDKWKHSFPERFAEAFALELGAFAETLLDDKPWPITGEQCVKVQRVADAARQSCLEGKLVELKY
jgi:myo-inositol 2-dehydrogenase / D-chiro-inositol 1-dehydrogenase